MVKLLKSLLILFIVLAFFPSPAMTQGLIENVELHGFASWAYGKTDGNAYLNGNEDGDYNQSDFYLNISANPTDKLTFSAQVGWKQEEEGAEVEYDYAFAQWKFADYLKFRVGKVKHPFGIYGEILNVGTLRPFMTLPQGIYGPQGFVAKGYTGLGFTGSYYTDNEWGLLYDLYAGALEAEVTYPSLILASFMDPPDPEYMNDNIIETKVDIDEMIGARLSVMTPLDGVNFGFSYYSGEEEESETGFSGEHTTYCIHFEYQSDSIVFRSEYAEHEIDGKFDILIKGAYIEAAYTFLEHYQVTARYDNSETEFPDVDSDMLPLFIKDFLQHQDISMGLNYWFNSNFALKLSYHMVKGIRFTFPTFEDPLDILLHNKYDDETSLIQFGAHFSF